MSERCKPTSERTSKWPSTYVSIQGCSEPQWAIPSHPLSVPLTRPLSSFFDSLAIRKDCLSCSFHLIVYNFDIYGSPVFLPLFYFRYFSLFAPSSLVSRIKGMTETKLRPGYGRLMLHIDHRIPQIMHTL